MTCRDMETPAHRLARMTRELDDAEKALRHFRGEPEDALRMRRAIRDRIAGLAQVTRYLSQPESST